MQYAIAQIGEIARWIDQSNAKSGIDSTHDDSMRVMKVGEEFGEVIAAYIGMTGQNPRKGVTHTKADLLAELADVAVTALCAIQHFTQNEDATQAVFTDKLDFIIKRISESEPAE